MSAEHRPPSHGSRAPGAGSPGRWFTQVGSTNDEAARWAAEGAPEGAFVVADEQTSGRGRRGRTWASPPGAGLYLSVVFRPVPGAGVADSLLTIMAGVAAAEGIRRVTGAPVTLKWPNDVIVDERELGHAWPNNEPPHPSWRKVAGILAEATSSGNVLQFVIVGIGINLRSAEWPPDVARRATSIEAVTGRIVDRDTLLFALLEALAAQRRVLLAGGAAGVLDAWRRFAPSSEGRRVAWETPGGRRSAVSAGIDVDGALLVQTPEGRERIVAGELFWE
jgi:BirA family transcriptional regulator, biotin operon repressor / biotin---[acetyl-CoA-carboxylase] ligase